MSTLVLNVIPAPGVTQAGVVALLTSQTLAFPRTGSTTTIPLYEPADPSPPFVVSPVSTQVTLQNSALASSLPLTAAEEAVLSQDIATYLASKTTIPATGVLAVKILVCFDLGFRVTLI
jgi:hypothetical protein